MRESRCPNCRSSDVKLLGRNRLLCSGCQSIFTPEGAVIWSKEMREINLTGNRKPTGGAAGPNPVIEEAKRRRAAAMGSER